jgi:hypothetical protein
MIRILKFALLIAVAGGAIFGVLQTAAIPQDIAYHYFFDQRSDYGIPNFWNVVSNLPFLLVGLSGFYLLSSYPQNVYLKQNRLFYVMYSLALCLIALGSSYYHLHPTNNTLLWDRLPMTLAFMSFFCIVLADYISHRLAIIALFPLIALAIAAVIYWHHTEAIDAGDLRFYALVQFLPMLLVILILLMFNQERLHSNMIWAMLAGYALAKVFEVYDREVYEFLGVVSGHSIKHVIAALSAYLLISRGEKIAIIKQALHRQYSENSDRVI